MPGRSRPKNSESQLFPFLKQLDFKKKKPALTPLPGAAYLATEF